MGSQGLLDLGDDGIVVGIHRDAVLVENRHGHHRDIAIVEQRLKEQADELERFNKLAVGREQRVIELKQEIKKSGRLNAKQKAKVQQKLEHDKIMQLCCDDIVQRRLVLKLFKTTGKRLNWAGSIEQITTNEVQYSIGSNRTLLSLAAILPRHEYLVHIQQNHRAVKWICCCPPANGSPWLCCAWRYTNWASMPCL